MEVRSKSKNTNKAQKSTQLVEKDKPQAAKTKTKVVLFF